VIAPGFGASVESGVVGLPFGLDSAPFRIAAASILLCTFDVPERDPGHPLNVIHIHEDPRLFGSYFKKPGGL
jgi:hypothetical protein